MSGTERAAPAPTPGRVDLPSRMRQSRELAARASSRAADARAADAEHRRQLQRMRDHELSVVLLEAGAAHACTTALPRGGRSSHQLLCGACRAVLAVGYVPGDLEVVLTCFRCGAANH